MNKTDSVNRLQVTGYSKKDNSSHGFTLIELLVTITIISIMATVGLVMYKSAQDSAKMAKTQAKMRDIRLILEDYRARYGELPPLGGGGSTESTITTVPTITWGILLDEFVANNLISSIDKNNYSKDEWGIPFHYVDYDKVIGGGTFSLLWTSGPNKVTNRDIANTPVYSNGKNCGGDDWCLDLPYGK